MIYPIPPKVVVRSVAILLTVAVGTAFIHNQLRAPQVHVLQFPLLLAGPSGDMPLHTLPAGTTMYFDRSYPEGFTRYKVYVNVDRLPLPLTTLADRTAINPITAWKMDKDDLKRPSGHNPVTREWLASILKSGQLSRDEIREVLADYATGCAMAPVQESDGLYAHARSIRHPRAKLALNSVR
jgi:hypothetical protein